MKIVVASLMCLVFSTMQCLALKGGPNYGIQTEVTGNYAGVFASLPCDGRDLPEGFPQTGRCGANTIGIFSMQVPRAGTATGPFIIFTEGQPYVGTIQGTANPQSGRLNALITGSFTYKQAVVDRETTTDKDGNVTVKETTKFESFTANAAGQVNAIVGSRSSGLGTAGTRVHGYANVLFSLTVLNPFDEITYEVVGYKQSSL